MKKALSIVVLTLFSIAAFAQISYGPKLGLTFSRYGTNYADGIEEPELQYKLGPQIGLMMDFQILEFLSFQPSLMYSKKGTGYNIEDEYSGDYVITGYRRDRISYLELPLNLALKLKLGPVKFQVFAGPYFAYAIAGKRVWDYEENLNGIREDIKGDGKFEFVNKLPEEQKDDVFYQRPFDAGIDFGLGFQVSKVLINFGYAMGFTNLRPEISNSEFSADDLKYSNRTIFLNAAWLFGE
jgi:hypothetical protein